MDILARCKKLGIEIPTARQPGGTFSPVVKVGELVFTSGQTAKIEGKLLYIGKVGSDLTLEEGQEAAKICVRNCLALINDFGGGLDNVKRIVRLTGYVNSAHGFTKQGAVIEAASHLLYQIFGELGLHARTSFGVTELPGDSACEIELIAQVAI
ncbi:putative endoribonuclease L-PSP [uncultured Clostridium sp.]|uniref:RidA family protein n=1 Tax=Flintibacter hominis TaxID=2763048 RepID=A0A8J6J968_9FIRM|nr:MULTISPECIES: RidA family protein [Eubacteriales]MBC5721968.1 RidA family protein [Flintibacter hominis]MCU6702088.1 RidA family protein [Muriventricola aceti]SCH63560.1 putative endoribonuclease L-PSP [uncultured Clostridium sp.]SCI89273.1 putative endoribonuclease L-PSP [uncultured Flavonifractor sp.]